MKPWPAELAARYPLAPLPGGSREVPYPWQERPWWTLIDMVRSPAGGPPLHEKTVAYRRDGVVITQYGKALLDAGSGFGQRKVPSTKQGGSWQVERALLIAECDGKRPIAHPGFRAGQLWAIPAVRHRECTDEACELHPAGEGFDVAVLSYEHVFPAALGPWHLSAGYAGPFAERALRAILKDAYLVADMACPWLAPWSPPSSSPLSARVSA